MGRLAALMIVSSSQRQVIVKEFEKISGVEPIQRQLQSLLNGILVSGGKVSII